MRLLIPLALAALAAIPLTAQSTPPTGPCPGGITNVGTAGQLLSINAITRKCTWITASGTGTVTSVALTIPTILSIAGSPVTSAGTLALTLSTQTANKVFAGPTSGGAATSAFRSLVLADLPSPFAAVTSAQGNGLKMQLSTGTTTTDHCVKYDADGNTVDAGAACGSGGGGSGTVTVVGSGNLGSMALVTGGGSQTLQTPATTATMDSSGNISTPGSITTGASGSVAGAIQLGQGTATSPAANSVVIQAPASVTAYSLTLPAAAGTGFVLNTDTAGVGAFTFVGSTGSGNVARATSPTLVTPILGVAAATSVNKVALTAPATSATLTIPDGVTLTGPASSGTAATLGNTETFSGAKIFTAKVDASGATQFFPRSGTSLPATCTVGEVYNKTDATAGQNWYFCTATNTWTQQLNSGGGGSGGGVVNYSAPSITLSAGTTYFPFGGGGLPSGTEANSQTLYQAAATVSNFAVSTSAALGGGNQIVWTLRDNGADTTVTCTQGNATSCSDTTHSANTVAGHLYDVKAVITGTIVGTPMVMMVAAFGTSSVGITSIFGSTGPVVGAVGDIGATGTVLQVNGAAVPTSAAVLGSNGSNQLTSVTTATTKTNSAIVKTGATGYTDSTFTLPVGFFSPSDVVLTSVVGLATTAINQIRFYSYTQFVPTTFSTFTVNIKVTDSNSYDLAIYDSPGAAGGTANLVAHTGATANFGSTGQKTINVSGGAVILAQGRYEFAVCSNGSTFALNLSAGGGGGSQTIPLAISSSSTAASGGVCPSTMTVPADTWTTGTVPYLVLR